MIADFLHKIGEVKYRYLWKALEFVIIIALACMMDLEEFGIGFLVMTTIYFLTSFMLPNYQEEDAKKAKKFYNLLSVVLPMAGLLISASIFAISFLFSERLSAAYRLSAVLIMFKSFSATPEMFFSQRSSLVKIYKPYFFSQIVMGMISLPMAFLGFGYESILYGYIGASLLSMVLLWNYFPFKPKPKIDKEIFAHLIDVWKMNLPVVLGISLYYYGFLMISALLFGLTNFTYLYLAYLVGFFIYENLTIYLNSLMMPKFREMTEDVFRYNIVRFSEYVSLVAVPFTAMIVVISPFVIGYFMTPSWTRLFEILILVSIAGMLKSVSETTRIIFGVKSKNEIIYRILFFELAVLFVSVVIFGFFGAIGAGIALLLSAAFSAVLYIVLSTRLLKFDILTTSKDFAYILVSSVITALSVGLLEEFMPIRGPIGVISYILVGLVLYVGLIFFFNRDLSKRFVKFLFQIGEK